jgi:hypothetical protein
MPKTKLEKVRESLATTIRDRLANSQSIPSNRLIMTGIDILGPDHKDVLALAPLLTEEHEAQNQLVVIVNVDAGKEGGFILLSRDPLRRKTPTYSTNMFVLDMTDEIIVDGAAGRFNVAVHTAATIILGLWQKGIRVGEEPYLSMFRAVLHQAQVVSDIEDDELAKGGPDLPKPKPDPKPGSIDQKS